MVWLLSVTLSAQAQSTTPPVLQWQRVIEGNIDFNSTIYAAKSTTGEFGILTGTTLTPPDGVGGGEVVAHRRRIGCHL